MAAFVSHAKGNASVLLGALQAVQDGSAHRLSDDEDQQRVAVQVARLGSLILRYDRQEEAISRIRRAWPELNAEETSRVLAELFAVMRETLSQPERDVASRREQAARQSSNWVHSWTRRDHDGGIR